MIDEIDQWKTDIINEIWSLDNAKRTKVIDIRNSLNSREFILKTHYLFQTFVKKRFMNWESINENQKAQKVFLRVMKNQNFYEKLKTIYQDFISTSKEQLSKKEILFIDYEILKTKMIQSTIRSKLTLQ